MPDVATLSASLASASLQEFRAACTLALREAPRTTVHPATVANEVRDSAVLLSWLYEQGWSRYGWPESVGGLGGPATLRGEVYDELAAQGLSIPAHLYVLETVGPAVLHFAPELAAELLPAAMAGRELWCQGFSEPEAGSDLASLRTRATEHGDELRVSGQKIWTSYGALAQRMVALIRTGEADSRHRGLTMLLLDLDAPGVTARPIALASGREELAEVFFDDTPVPRSRVIGEINGGWAVAMHLLQFERGMYAWMRMAMTTQRLQALLRLVPADAPGAYETIGRAHLAVSALRARTGETLRRLSAGETVGPETSVDKVLLAAAEQGVMDAAHELLPTTFLYDEAGVSWRDEWWYSRAASIYGGAGEIQRTIIADRLLGLPKEDRGR
jgi:alkylation response protein AidB-like acyl-CoA dehydrogenase